MFQIFKKDWVKLPSMTSYVSKGSFWNRSLVRGGVQPWLSILYYIALRCLSVYFSTVSKLYCSEECDVVDWLWWVDWKDFLLNAAVCLNPQSDEESGSQHFGVRVCRLVSDKNPVPMVLEMLLEHVEMHGLYTEGIYRKSGSANRMKELHQRLETG